ncbi:hypothetical protein ACFQZ4_42460 [Catellatospora coxensis]
MSDLVAERSVRRNPPADRGTVFLSDVGEPGKPGERHLEAGQLLEVEFVDNVSVASRIDEGTTVVDFPSSTCETYARAVTRPPMPSRRRARRGRKRDACCGTADSGRFSKAMC